MNCLRKSVANLTALAAVLAFAATPVSAAPSPKFKPMTYVGVVESATVPHNPYDPSEVEKAQWMIASAKTAGATTLKVIRDWNETGDPGEDELTALCVTARAMAANGMKSLLITLMPQKYGWPNTEESLRLFNQTIERYITAFFGPRGCVSKIQLEVMWQPGNEPNIATFCRTGNDRVDDDENGRHAGCARLFVSLQQSVFRFIQQQEELYGVNMPVVGAGIGSHHSPISFMHHVNNAMQLYRFKHPGMDVFGFHPYALRGSIKPDSGLSLTPKLMAVARVVLGKNIQFMYDEMGFETVTPAEKRDQNCTTPPSVMLIPEPHYPSWTRVTLKMSKAQGAVGYLNFLLVDERCENPGWQSGLYYWDRTAKPFLAEVSKVIRSYTAQPSSSSTTNLKRPLN